VESASGPPRKYYALTEEGINFLNELKITGMNCIMRYNKFLNLKNMNKTISINIGGFVFNIEENAYQKLYHYLSTIKKNFTEVEEREEIMGDIEARIAEIFQTKLSAGKKL